MALKKQLIQVPMTDGLNQGTAPLLVQKGLLRLQNCVFEKDGTISKCTGMADTTATTYTEDAMGVLNDRPLLIDSSAVKTLDGDDTSSAWSNASNLFITDHSIEYLTATSDVKNLSLAERDDVRAVVFTAISPSGAESDWCHTYAMDSGKLLDTQLMSGSGGVRVLDTGARLIVLNRTTAGAIALSEINTATGVIGSASTLSGPSNVSNTYRFDCCRVGTTNTIMIAYNDSTAIDGVVYTVDDDDTEHGPENVALVGPYSVGCFNHGSADPGGNQFAVALFVDDTGGAYTNLVTYALMIDNSCTRLDTETVFSHATDVPINMCGGPISSTVSMVYFGVHTTAGGLNQHRTYRTSITFGSGTMTINTGNVLIYGFLPFSYPMIKSTSRHYLLLQAVNVSDDQTSFVLIRSETNEGGDGLNGEIVARILPGYGAVPRPSLAYGEMCGHIEVGTANKTYRALVNVKTAARRYSTSSVSYNTSTVGLVTFDIDKLAPMSVTGSDRVLIEGSVGYEFDGTNAFESGFLYYPPAPGLAASGSASFSGTFNYIISYLFIDASGAIHRSTPSPAAEVTVSSAAHIDVTCQTTKAHRVAIDGDVIIEIWRTEDDGSFFYKVGEIANSQDAATVTHDDSVADAQLIQNEALYAQPGGSVLDYMSPPPWDVGCIHQERSFVVDKENPSTRIIYSNVKVPRAGYHWNDTLYIDVPVTGGEITALASYQDKLLIFKKNRIYATYGTGYDSNGSGTNYASPVMIDPSVGCSIQKSVVQCPSGLLFKADHLIWMIDSKMSLVPIGEGAEYATENVVIRRGLNVYEKDYVVFLTSGNSAVYHYLSNTWSTFTWDGGIDGCVALDGTLMYIRGDASEANVVVAESRAAYTFRTADYQQVIETGWISPSGPGGWGRVYSVLFGGHIENSAAWVLRCKFAYDGSPYWADSQAYLGNTLPKINESDQYGTGLASTYADDAMVIDFANNQQKCTSIRIHLSSETGDAGPGKGFSLSWIALVAGIKSGEFRLGSARRA